MKINLNQATSPFQKMRKHFINFKALKNWWACGTILFVLLAVSCEDKSKDIPPPEIYMAIDGEELEFSVGDTIVLEPKITYNIEPYFQ